MKRLIWIICMVGFANTAPAADIRAFDIDYAALFAAQTTKVMQAEPNRRVLELPGPVIVTETSYRDGQVRYHGVDHSGNGALGCSFSMLLDIVALGQNCPNVLTTEELARLQQGLQTMAKVVGANTYPRVARAEVLPRLHALLAERRTQLSAAFCPSPDSGVADIVTYARNLAGPAGQAALQRAMQQPRLPVSNPC